MSLVNKIFRSIWNLSLILSFLGAVPSQADTRIGASSSSDGPFSYYKKRREGLDSRREEAFARVSELEDELKDVSRSGGDFGVNNCGGCHPEGSLCTVIWDELKLKSKLQSPAEDTTSCRLLWSRVGKKLNKIMSLDPGCEQAVRECGVVAREIRIQELEEDIRRAKAEAKAVDSQEESLFKAEARERQYCPDCEFRYRMAELNKPREPKFWDYALGFTQALAPVGLGIIGTIQQSNALDAYGSWYGSYLDQCKTVGVPCTGPGMGMGMGMGGYGMGAYGAGGYGIGTGGGMGFPGGGGLGLGLGIGLGIGGGMMPGMGMGGYGMMPGMAMGMGMGGYGMMPMMPSMPMMPGYGLPGLGISGGIGLGINGGFNGGYPGMMSGGLYPSGGYFAAPGGYAMNPYGVGFQSGLYPFGPMYPGYSSGNVFGPGVQGGYPGMTGYPGFSAGYPGVGFNLGLNGGLGMNGGFNGGISGYPGYPGGMYSSPSVMSPWMNPQYQAMQQASLQAQMQAAARAQQSNQNLMIAQQQAMEAMSRYQNTAYGYGMGNYGYSNGLYGGLSGGIYGGLYGGLGTFGGMPSYGASPYGGTGNGYGSTF